MPMRGAEPEFVTWCGTCREVRGAALEPNRGNPRWRVSRHHDDDGRWCGGGRVVVDAKAVVPTGTPVPLPV